MSTYTDLHNRVKENLTVDYHTRITTQKISALNEENLFVGKFSGQFTGGAISQVSCIDCSVIGGTAASALMIEPFLSVGYDPQTEEPIISSLTAYIDAHGGSGGGGHLVYINDLSVGHSLSCRFDSVYDVAQHQLSDLLDELGGATTVLNICLRVNEIKRLADLADVPEIDCTTDKVADLFTAVETIAPARPVRTFAQVVESLNLSLSELSVATTGASLESRLHALSDNISIVTAYVNRLSSDFSSDISYLSAQISAISPETEARLQAVEGRVLAVESDYLKHADKTSLQSQIGLRLEKTQFETEKKAFCQSVYTALSALPADPLVLDIDTVSKVLFDIRSLFNSLKV